MNILHCVPSLDPAQGGPSRAVVELAAMSSRAGDSVTVCCAADAGTAAIIDQHRTLFPTVEFLCFRRSFPRRFSASAQMMKWLNENISRFAVVHIHGIYSVCSLGAGRVAARRGIPYIVRPAGSLDKFDLKKKSFFKRTIALPPVRQHLAHAATVHCTSRLEAEHLEKFGAKTSVQVLPIPVNVEATKGDLKRFRERHGLYEADFVWLFLSRIDYKKGLDILLPSVAKLATKFPRMRLVIAGGDSDGYANKVRRWIDELKLSEIVCLCGFLSGDSKNDALAGSDCFVLPSMNENFGVAVVEALGAGLPAVISKNVYIWQEIVSIGGAWVCDFDVASLAEKMDEVMSDPVRLVAERKRALLAAAQFSPGTLEPLYREFYKRISRR